MIDMMERRRCGETGKSEKWSPGTGGCLKNKRKPEPDRQGNYRTENPGESFYQQGIC